MSEPWPQSLPYVDDAFGRRWRLHIEQVPAGYDTSRFPWKRRRASEARAQVTALAEREGLSFVLRCPAGDRRRCLKMWRDLIAQIDDR